MADQRLPEYPDAPTLKELGYANGKGLWSALYAPAKTPRTCLRRCTGTVVQALKSAPVQEAFKKQMIKAGPGCLDRGGGQAWNAARGRSLEEAHRRGEGRAAGVTALSFRRCTCGAVETASRGSTAPAAHRFETLASQLLGRAPE